MTGKPGEPYKPPYKLTSDAYEKHRGQPGEGTKEMVALQAGRYGWVGGAWVVSSHRAAQGWDCRRILGGGGVGDGGCRRGGFGPLLPAHQGESSGHAGPNLTSSTGG